MQSVSAIERRTMAKVYLRLLPFCFVLYFICYLDRVNIGFAALTMNKDIGLSSYVFGLGAGAFFWGYFILEVPSNLIEGENRMINGRTELIAHLGYPTETFTAPMIYNPWFASRGINAVVVPMGVRAEDYAGFLRPLFRLSNLRGALVTMPHKVPTVSLLDEAAVAVQVAGSCNAILRRPDGSLYGDLFDGIGFVRGAKRKGFDFAGADCLIVGAGGVGSAISAAIAAEEPGSIALFDIDTPAAERLAGRLRQRFPDLAVGLRGNDPAGYRLVVNATPLGASVGDPLPFDPMRLEGEAFVGDVVLTAELTPLLKAAARRGCRYQIGTDMLFEQIPAYIEFFGYGTATADELRAVSRISY